MFLSDTVNDGLVQTMNRLCGTTTTTYPFKQKTADLNDALDWYISLAKEADREWNTDDTGQTSPPIEAQSIVSGTNRYKFSAFSSEILDLLKLEVLDTNRNGLDLIPETLNSMGSVVGAESGRISGSGGGSFQQQYIDAPSGTPTHYIKYGDFVYLRPNPDYSKASGLLAYIHRPLTKFNFVSCQAEADNELITAVGHGLVAGDTVIFEIDASGTLPGNITADTQYFVIATGLTADVFSVSATLGGSAVNISSDGSNVHFLKTSAEPGIPSTHHKILAHKASSEFLSFNNTNGVYNSRLSLVLPQLAKEEKMIETHFARKGKDISSRMSVFQEDNR